MASRSTPRQQLTRRSTAAFPGWKSSVRGARPRTTSIWQPSSTRRPPSCTILQAVCAAASAPRPGGAPPRPCSNLVGSRVTLEGRSRLRSQQESLTVVSSNHERTPKVQTATAYLETLNPEQRRAVEHGPAGGLAAPPLLVIAGAGSGKTNTLAHRVAHLIVQGADPRRILLMTFSRRAASEMTKRVERIARKVLGDNAGIMTDALTWAGTYHGIGARLLREYAEQIGLDPAFTIHDREDSADLMNLVRHEKEFSNTESRFPTKGTCLSIYSPLRQCRAADRAGHRRIVSMVRRMGGGAQGIVRSLCRSQAEAERSRLRRSPALLGADGRRRWPRR